MNTKSRRNITVAILMLVMLGLVLGATSAVAASFESYNESWNLPLQPEDGIAVDMSAVDVIIEQYEQTELSVTFEGRRAQASDGTMPYIAVEQKNGQITIKTIWPKQGILNFNSGKLEGTLTILVPDVTLAGVSLSTFSGGVTMEGQAMKDLSIDTSSGNVKARNLEVSGDLSVNAFSGSHALEALNARDITLGGSSGSISATNLHATGALNANTFSGNQAYADVSANDMYVEASSGNITGSNVKVSGDLTLSTFSGKQTMQAVEAVTINTSASSGNVDWKDVQGTSLTAETFSGNITATQLAIDESVSLSTSSRDIIMDGLTTSLLELNTFSGSIRAGGLNVDVFTANTSSGGCVAAFTGNADVTVETFSGDVDLTFPAGAGMDYQYDTFSGGATIHAPNAGAQEMDGKSVSGTIGDAASTVAVNTSSGRLTLTVAE